MKKPMEQMTDMLDWLRNTAHAGAAARCSIGIGDAEHRSDAFFLRAGQINLSIEEITRRAPFYRAANSVGLAGKADRPLNIYISSAVSLPQSWLLLDDLGIEECQQIAGKRTNMVIQTSPGRHHLWLATSRPVSVVERKVCQQVLQQKFGGDAGSVSGDHFGRLCGFKNIKRNCWVNFISESTSDRRADIDKLLILATEMGLSPFSSPSGVCDSSSPQACVSSSPQGVAPQARPLSHSHNVSSSLSPSGRDESKAEFGWACGWLSKNLNLADGIARLTQRAADRHKPKPEQYARRTFDKAARSILK